MSDNWISIIPEQPDLVPDNEKQYRALNYFLTLAEQNPVVHFKVNARVAFVDCGGNFEKVACPSCRADISIAVWRDWMDQDFDGEGFILKSRTMPCCGANHTLHDLSYELPQGFARYELSARNADLGRLPQGVRRHFEEILDCPIRIIYRHI